MRRVSSESEWISPRRSVYSSSIPFFVASSRSAVVSISLTSTNGLIPFRRAGPDSIAQPEVAVLAKDQTGGFKVLHGQPANEPDPLPFRVDFRQTAVDQPYRDQLTVQQSAGLQIQSNLENYTDPVGSF